MLWKRLQMGDVAPDMLLEFCAWEEERKAMWWALGLWGGERRIQNLLGMEMKEGLQMKRRVRTIREYLELEEASGS
jgi:hypothetical protein